jgi:hypothetical protein
MGPTLRAVTSGDLPDAPSRGETTETHGNKSDSAKRAVRKSAKPLTEAANVMTAPATMAPSVMAKTATALTTPKPCWRG